MRTMDFGGPQDPLRCPNCGGDHVHLDHSVVVARRGEDGPRTLVHASHRGGAQLTDEDGTLLVDGSPLWRRDLAPEGRRHSITLVGTCEGCDRLLVLEFRQHKGQTFLHTRVP